MKDWLDDMVEREGALSVVTLVPLGLVGWTVFGVLAAGAVTMAVTMACVGRIRSAFGRVGAAGAGRVTRPSGTAAGEGEPPARHPRANGPARYKRHSHRHHQ